MKSVIAIVAVLSSVVVGQSHLTNSGPTSGELALGVVKAISEDGSVTQEYNCGDYLIRQDSSATIPEPRTVLTALGTSNAKILVSVSRKKITVRQDETRKTPTAIFLFQNSPQILMTNIKGTIYIKIEDKDVEEIQLTMTNADREKSAKCLPAP